MPQQLVIPPVQFFEPPTTHYGYGGVGADCSHDPPSEPTPPDLQHPLTNLPGGAPTKGVGPIDPERTYPKRNHVLEVF